MDATDQQLFCPFLRKDARTSVATLANKLGACLCGTVTNRD
jgi:hypothetical protein